MKLLVFTAAVLSVAAGYAGVVGVCDRAPGDTALSGIASVGDGTYWAVDDSGVIVKGRIDVDADQTAAQRISWTRTDRFRCLGIDDPEGVAYDRADGTLWIADETGPEIWHVDPKRMASVGKVALPPVYRTIEKNRGIEALAIGNDGLTLWTANEDVLPGDEGSGCVRLQRFSRASVTNDWTASGQWAYRLTSPTQVVSAKKTKTRNGLAELCVASNGDLLALEREKVKVKKSLPQFRLRLFKVELDGATDVAALSSLASGEIKPVRKIQLCDMPTGNAMYEAIGQGPRLQDGKDSYVLVSDGDKGCDEKVMVLTLP